MARITFGFGGAQGEAEVKKADAKANVPDFLREVPEAKSVEEFFVGGFIRIWGSWVYITQLVSEQQVVAVAKMRLATFAKWLAVAVTQGADGWSAEPTWGLQTLPKYAKPDWAASRFGIVFHPEGEEAAPYTKGAFLSAWAATATLSGGSYPCAEDWGWTTSKTWFVPKDYRDAPLVYRGQPLPLAIEKMAKDYLEGTSQERSKKLFNNTIFNNTIEEDIPF
jgi:hypothetical protein